MAEFDASKRFAGRSVHELTRAPGQDAGPLTMAVAGEALPALPALVFAGPHRSLASAPPVNEESWEDVQRERIRQERLRVIPPPDPLVALAQGPLESRQRFFESRLGIRDGQDAVAIYNIKTTFFYDTLTYRLLVQLVEWRRFMYRAFFVVHTNFEARYREAERLKGKHVTGDDLQKMLKLEDRALDLTLPSQYGCIEEEYHKNRQALDQQRRPGTWKSYPNLATTIVTDAAGAPPATADGKYDHVRPVYQHVDEGFTAFAQLNRVVHSPAQHFFDRAVNPTDDRLGGGVFDIMQELQVPESMPALDATCVNLMGHAFESADLFSTFLMRRPALEGVVVFPKLAKKDTYLTGAGEVRAEFDHYDLCIATAEGFEKNVPPRGPQHVLAAADFCLRDFFQLCVSDDAVRFAAGRKELNQSDLVAVMQFYLRHFDGDAAKAHAMFLFWLELRLLAIFLVQFCFPCVEEMTRHVAKQEGGGKWSLGEWKFKYQSPIPIAQDPPPPDARSAAAERTGFPWWCLAQHRARVKADPKRSAWERALDAEYVAIVDDKQGSAPRAWDQPNAQLESLWAPYPDLKEVTREDIVRPRCTLGFRHMMPFLCWPVERICDPLSLKPRTIDEALLGGGDAFARAVIPAFLHCMKQRLTVRGLEEEVREVLARLHRLGNQWTSDGLIALRKELGQPSPPATAAVSPPQQKAEPAVNMTDDLPDAEDTDGDEPPPSPPPTEEAKEKDEEEEKPSKRQRKSNSGATATVTAAAGRKRAGPEPSTRPPPKGAPAAAAASRGSVAADDEEDAAMSDGENQRSRRTPKARISGGFPPAAAAPASLEAARLIYAGFSTRNPLPKETAPVEEDDEETPSRSTKKPRRKSASRRAVQSEQAEESGDEQEESQSDAANAASSPASSLPADRSRATADEVSSSIKFAVAELDKIFTASQKWSSVLATWYHRRFQNFWTLGREMAETAIPCDLPAPIVAAILQMEKQLGADEARHAQRYVSTVLGFVQRCVADRASAPWKGTDEEPWSHGRALETLKAARAVYTKRKTLDSARGRLLSLQIPPKLAVLLRDTNSGAVPKTLQDGVHSMLLFMIYASTNSDRVPEQCRFKESDVNAFMPHKPNDETYQMGYSNWGRYRLKPSGSPLYKKCPGYAPFALFDELLRYDFLMPCHCLFGYDLTFDATDDFDIEEVQGSSSSKKKKKKKGGR